MHPDNSLWWFWATFLACCAIATIAYSLVRLFRRWPRATMMALSAVIVFGIGVYLLATSGWLWLVLRTLSGA